MALAQPFDWTRYSACKGAPEEIFFSKENELSKIKQAKAYCDKCPVRFDCLEEALEFPEQPGIFGGTTSIQRKNITALLIATHAS